MAMAMAMATEMEVEKEMAMAMAMAMVKQTKKRKRMAPKNKKKKKRMKKQARKQLCILSSLYPPHRILTLKDLLAALLLPGFPSPESTQAWLLRKDDSPEYASLLHHGYGILSDSAPAIGLPSLEQKWTHQEVIERAIQIQFRQGNNTSNVLCFGFQQPRPRSIMEMERVRPTGLACISYSAAIAILNSEVWSKVHSRVGDSIMLYLLMHADLFHPLPRRCFAQVAGTSVLLANEHFIESFNSNVKGSLRRKKWIDTQQNKIADVSQSKISPEKDYGDISIVQNISQQKLQDVELPSCSCTNVQMNMKNEQTGAKRSAGITISESSKNLVGPCSWQHIHDAVLASSAIVNRAVKECSNETMTSKSSKKRSRPSSWQRRKMRRNANQDVIIASSGMDTVECANDINEAGTSSNCSNAAMSIPLCKGHSAKTCSFSNTIKGKVLETVVPVVARAAKFPRRDHVLSRIKTCFNSSLISSNGMNLSVHEEPLPNSANQDRTRKDNEGIVAERQNPLLSKTTPKALPVPKPQGSGMGGKVIDRARMFYKAKFPRHAGLPKNHILCKLKCTYNDARVLFKDIFGLQSACSLNDFGNCGCVSSKNYQDSMCRLLKKLISNAKRCQYACLLERHCPAIHVKASHLPKKRKMTTLNHSECSATQNIKSCNTSICGNANEKTVSSETNLSELFSSHSQVVAFLWAVCRRVIPVELLGSKANWRQLRKNIYDFVHLRRYECCTLQQCMFKLKLSGYLWCQGKSFAGCKTIFTSAAEGKAYKNVPAEGVLNDGRALPSGICAFTGSFIHCNKKNFNSLRLGRSMLEEWIEWLFSRLLIPLLQAHFYITESEKYRQNVLFYRKCVWAKMKNAALTEILKSNFTRLSTKSTVKLLKDRTLGYSRARLLPKKSGMRLIANLGSYSVLPAPSSHDKEMRRTSRKSQLLNENEKLGKNSMMAVDKKLATVQDGAKLNTFHSKLVFKPINIVLRDIHYCLKFEQEIHSEKLGYSVFDYNDIYLKLVPFVVGFKESPKGASQLYLVVCDILKAYDTIKQDKLIDILGDFIQEPEYSVRRYSYVSQSSKLLAPPSIKPIKVQRERSAMPTVKSIDFLEDFIQKAGKHVNAVCVDQAHSTNLKENYVKHILQEHILRNVVQIGDHFYLQVVGIPQGSILSSLFCSLYFGHLERYRLTLPLQLNQNRSLPPSHKRECSAIKTTKSTKQLTGSNVLPRSCIGAEGPQNVLLRLVDDFLFISDSQENAIDFAIKMHKGFLEYNCVANRRKTALSFDGNIGGSQLKMNVYRTEDGACYMRWSGLLINCNTLEVQADYTRYAGVKLQSTLTVWRKKSQGYHLLIKLCQFMRPKCHPIFYDNNINSPATVFLNAYQAFLLCAMKFHAYNRSLPCNGKCNPEFGFKAVKRTVRYMYSLLEHRTKKISSSSQVKPIVRVHSEELEWLALCAFHRALVRKQSRYKDLLRLIEERLEARQYSRFRSSPAMVSALDARRSSMFKYIIY